VTISGCCWCGKRTTYVERDVSGAVYAGYDNPKVVMFNAMRAYPCGHEVAGDVYAPVGRGLIYTLWPPGAQAPHMHPTEQVTPAVGTWSPSPFSASRREMRAVLRRHGEQQLHLALLVDPPPEPAGWRAVPIGPVVTVCGAQLDDNAVVVRRRARHLCSRCRREAGNG
jgi:hypothetical protein